MAAAVGGIATDHLDVGLGFVGFFSWSPEMKEW